MTGLLDQAEREAATIMPGFTHLQTAQPVTFGHHLLAWAARYDRLRQRPMFGINGRFGHGIVVASGDPDTVECVACSAHRQRTVSPITNTEYAR